MLKFLKNKVFLTIVGIIFLFIILNFIIPEKYLLHPMRDLFFRLSTPITSIFYQGGKKTDSFFSKISEIRRLSDDKMELEKKNAELVLENSKLKEAIEENEQLRQQLGLKEQLKDKEFAVADIIGRGPTNISGVLIINKGRDEGLSVGMPVVSGQMLVGRLTEIGDKFSRVTLIIDPSSVINIMIQDTRALGILRGEVGFNLKIDSVPQETVLAVGQRIITSGLGSTMPKGLVVGDVSEITSPESEIFQSAKIKPAVDFNHLEIVFIIKS